MKKILQGLDGNQFPKWNCKKQKWQKTWRQRVCAETVSEDHLARQATNCRQKLETSLKTGHVDCIIVVRVTSWKLRHHCGDMHAATEPECGWHAKWGQQQQHRKQRLQQQQRNQETGRLIQARTSFKTHKHPFVDLFAPKYAQIQSFTVILADLDFTKKPRFSCLPHFENDG